MQKNYVNYYFLIHEIRYQHPRHPKVTSAQRLFARAGVHSFYPPNPYSVFPLRLSACTTSMAVWLGVWSRKAVRTVEFFR